MASFSQTIQFMKYSTLLSLCLGWCFGPQLGEAFLDSQGFGLAQNAPRPANSFNHASRQGSARSQLQAPRQRLEEQMPEFANSNDNQDIGPDRYMKDLNRLNSIATVQEPMDSAQLARINQLLESLGSYIAIQSPAHHSGRASGKIPRIDLENRVNSAMEGSDGVLLERGTRDHSNGRQILGIVWPAVPRANNIPNQRRSDTFSSSQPGEVAMHAPMLPRHISEADWKRTSAENSRWNNLRGMWGKRSIYEPRGMAELGDQDDG